MTDMIPAFTLSMSSREIADLTVKQHSHVLRDIRAMLVQIYASADDPNLDHAEIKGVSFEKDSRGYTACIHLDKEHTITLLTGYDAKARHRVTVRWIELESAATAPALTPILPEQRAALAIPAVLSISHALGVPVHLAQVEAVKHAARTYGYDAAPLLACAPAQDGIHDGEVMLEPTELAPRLGIADAKTVNNRLRDMGLQIKRNGEWTPTADGQPFCARHAWRKGDKSGYNLKWRLTALRDLIQATGGAA